MRYPRSTVDALTKAGYTAREARFLYLVATHSGYFLRRHFLKFARVPHGGRVNDFLRKATDNRHIKEELHSPKGANRYHLYSRPLYALMGKENSTHRKKHHVPKINVKLHALDFVLDHLKGDFLEEEADKVGFFESMLKVALAKLPGRVYQSWNSDHAPCSRYFVDKFPLFVSEDGLLTFTYVDAILQTLHPFRTHLLQYLPLFRALETPFRLTFISPTDTKFPDAERIFYSVLDAPTDTSPNADVIEYFDLRRRFETKNLRGFTDQTFKKRIAGAKKYAGSAYEALYEKWLQDPAIFHRDSSPKPRKHHAQFTTYRATV